MTTEEENEKRPRRSPLRGLFIGVVLTGVLYPHAWWMLFGHPLMLLVAFLAGAAAGMVLLSVASVKR